jgi:hypothetical protein
LYDVNAQQSFTPTKKQGLIKLNSEVKAARKQNVTVNTSLLRGADNERFALIMPDGVKMSVVGESESKYLKNGYVCVGGIEGQLAGKVIFRIQNHLSLRFISRQGFLHSYHSAILFVKGLWHRKYPRR